MDVFPHADFRRCVARYRGDRRVRSFSCHDQFLTMAFAQLTFRESLRDIEVCLRAVGPRLYHAGFRGSVARSTLADAAERRDWRLWRDFTMVLIERARRLYADEPLAVELDTTVFALDSTTIDLCLSVFPWAPFRTAKAAIKLHTVMDLRGSIPTFIHVSSGKMHDVRVLDLIAAQAGAFYVFDRAYVDYKRLWRLSNQGAFFVTRAKDNARFRRRASRPVDKTMGLRCDQSVVISGVLSGPRYPAPIRRVTYVDVQTGVRYTFLTNNFELPALTIAALYKGRWHIELFFRWIKQHLRIKAFYGTSENAVKTQIYTAISTYLLVAILKKQLGLEESLHTLLQVFSLTLFEKTLIFEAISSQIRTTDRDQQDGQLSLF